MIGTKIQKIKTTDENGNVSASYDKEQYKTAADWCNANNATIIDKGEYYEVETIPELSEEEKRALTQQQLTAVVQSWMDRTVQARNYDNIHTACTYAYSTDETFKKEGTACLAWRDNVWRTCYNILNEVLAGNREIPTEEELIAELPKLEW